MVRASRAVGVGRLCTARAGMAGSSWTLGAEAHACQMAFVSQNVPDLRPNGSVVSPIPPLSTDAATPPGGFERFQGLATDQVAPKGGCQQQQHIRRQVREFAVPCLIDAPTACNFLLIERAPGIIDGKRLAFGFELVNLATRACLMSINPTGL